MKLRDGRGLPAPAEYADYYGQYVELVPDADIVATLRDQAASSLELLQGVPAHKEEHRYAPEKWTVKEVVGHVLDMEWIFTNRVLRIARGDKTPLPGVDQDVLAGGGNFAQRSLASLCEEFRNLRSANTVLFDSFDAETLKRTGTASDCSFTVRSILYILAGHELHHMAVLKERYLG